jgi:hypothetical protein
MSLEDAIFGSSEIRNFLKLYSDHTWNKVCKATMLVGIARLMEVSVRSGKSIQNLSLEDLEEFAVVSLQK